MKTALIISIIVFGFLVPGKDVKAQWIRSLGINGSNVIGFAEIDNKIFAAVSDGGIFISDNNGISWMTVSTQFKDIRALAALDSTLFIGVGDTIYYSSDMGVTWNNSGPLDPKYGIRFISAINGNLYASIIAGGAGGYISKDRGKTWENIYNGITSNAIMTISSIRKEIFAGSAVLSGSGGIFHFNETKKCWDNAGLKFNSIFSLTSLDSFLVAGTYKGVYATSDLGNNWNLIGASSLPIWRVAIFKNKIFAGTKNGIYFSGNFDGKWNDINSGLTNFNITSLYVFKNTLFAGTGNSAEVYRLDLIPDLANDLPPVPVLLYPPNGSVNMSNKVTFSWNILPFSNNYRIQVSTDSLFINKVLDDTTGLSVSKDFNELSSGLKYYWRVCAINSSGAGKYTSASSFITTLPSPYSAAAENVGLKKVKFCWYDSNSNLSGFILERLASDERSYRVIDSIKFDDRMYEIRTYIDTTVLPSVKYSYRIKGYNQYTSSDYSNTAVINTITDVEDIKTKSADYTLMQNHPNPFNPATIIGYSIQKRSFIALKVYGMLGQEVATLINKEQNAGEYQVKFDASSLPSGIYIYTIQADKFRDSKKLLLLK